MGTRPVVLDAYLLCPIADSHTNAMHVVLINLTAMHNYIACLAN